MKKRSFIITLLLLSVMMIFSACVKKNSGKEEEPTDPTTTVETYTIVYVAQEGEDTVLTLNVGEQPAADKIPALGERVGYDAAWSVSDFSAATANEIVTVSAVYTPKKYAVTYDTNGGVAITQSTEVTYHREYLLATPVREGYNFLSWIDAEGKEVALSGDAWRYAEDLSLKATWEETTPDRCSVRFVEEGKEPVTLVVLAGESLATSALPTITDKTGYTAVWSVNGQAADFTNITSSMTVTPKYTPKSYQISFDAAGGTAVTDVVTVTYGEGYDFSNMVPEKAGVYFVNGWYLGDTNVAMSGSWSFDCEAEQTLTAKYSVKVTFKQSGFDDKIMYYLFGSSVTEAQLPATSPKTGYVVKWEKDVLQKLSNLQADVVIYSVEQDLSWSPVA